MSRRSREVSANIRCIVGTIGGETVIRTRKATIDAPPLHTLQHRELRASLRESTTDNVVLFSGRDGNFDWTFTGKGSGVTN